MRTMLTASPRLERGWDIALALLTLAILGWTTWCLGGYRPETMAISAPLWLSTLALAWARRAVVRSRGGWRPALAWWPLPFLVYAVGNVLYVSPVAWLGWLDFFSWLHLAAAYWLGLDLLRRPAARGLLWSGVAAIGFAAVGLAVYQRVADPEWLPLGRLQAAQYLERSGGPFGIPNSLAALLILLIPPAAGAAFEARRPLAWRCGAGIAAAAYLLGLVLTISRGAWLSLALAVAVAPLLVSAWTWRRRVGATTTVVLALAASAFVLYLSAPPVKSRLDALALDRGERTRPIMWRAAWDLFREAPVVGTGAGSYRVLLERHRPEGFRDDPKWAHNEYLNTLSDYGLAGFILSFGAAGAAGLWIGRRRRRSGRGCVADGQWITRGLDVGLIAFGLSLLVDFHLKIPALSMVLGLCLAEWVGRRSAPSEEAPSGGGWRISAGAAAAAVAVLAIALVRPRLLAEGERYAARQGLDRLAGIDDPAVLRSDLEPAIAAFRRAVRIDPANANAWGDLALALTQRAHDQAVDAGEVGREAEAAARTALAASDVVPEFWVHLGIALDLQGKWEEAGRCFSRALQLAPNQQAGWYYQAYHYSLRPASRPLARAALAICLRLDPGNPAAQALRDRLNSSP